MTMHSVFVAVLLSIFLVHGHGSDPDKSKNKESLHSVKLAPCQACKVLVESFKQEMEKTARGKFEGGDAAWEEEHLGSYARSEVRLVEIQENLCLTVERGKSQCHTLAEVLENHLEEWWFQKQDEDLHKFICIDTLKNCCAENRFGPECKPCPGYPDNVCNKSGKCK
ncbi:hypothetical protein L9F63_023621, partial [Diploptera punctata]